MQRGSLRMLRVRAGFTTRCEIWIGAWGQGTRKAVIPVEKKIWSESRKKVKQKSLERE